MQHNPFISVIFTQIITLVHWLILINRINKMRGDTGLYFRIGAPASATVLNRYFSDLDIYLACQVILFLVQRALHLKVNLCSMCYLKYFTKKRQWKTEIATSVQRNEMFFSWLRGEQSPWVSGWGWWAVCEEWCEQLWSGGEASTWPTETLLTSTTRYCWSETGQWMTHLILNTAEVLRMYVKSMHCDCIGTGIKNY